MPVTSITFTVTPGYSWTDGETLTYAKLRQTATPTIQGEASFSGVTLSPGDVQYTHLSTDIFTSAPTITWALTSEVLAYDGSAVKKGTVAALCAQAVTLQTALTASLDAANDYLLLYDASASGAKKVAPGYLLNLAVTGDVTFSTSGVATLANSGVTAAAYAFPTSVTVDAKGRVTAISAGAQGVRQFASAALTTEQTYQASGTEAVIPVDGTVPQNTEGQQLLTLAITPQSATSTLLIEANAQVSSDDSQKATLALFVDSVAGALAVGGDMAYAGHQVQMGLRHLVSSGSTSARTYKLRFGLEDNTYPVRVPAQTSPGYGSVAVVRMTITEIGS